ncbi:MAG: hypothetical protein ACT4OK_16010 [Gemmobacter sp.]
MARPLKRVIRRNLQDSLARMILPGNVLDGATGSRRHARANVAGRGALIEGFSAPPS